MGNYGDKTKLNAPQNGIKAMMRTRLRLVWRSTARLPDYYGLKAESAAAWRINTGAMPKTRGKTTRIFKMGNADAADDQTAFGQKHFYLMLFTELKPQGKQDERE